MASAPPNFLTNFTKNVTLIAATPQDVDVQLQGARDWIIVVANTGATNDVTALTYKRCPLGNLLGPSHSASAGIPLAAAATLEIEGSDEPMTFLRLTLTSTSGTTVSIEAGGW